MPYDLLIAGGTGQWLLLQAALRKTAPLPSRFWLVDRDFRPSEAADETDPTARFYKTFKKVLGDTGVDEAALLAAHAPPKIPPRTVRVNDWLGSNSETSTDVLAAALSSNERNQDVTTGFHALPRLGAVWASVHGFDGSGAVQAPDQQIRTPACFANNILNDPNGGPLVIAGSIGGGTGAGLLPLFLRRARVGVPAVWKRPVIVIAFLPWFNPGAGGGGRGVGVDWATTCRNAAQGVHALFRVMDDLKRDAGAGVAIPWTHCLFVGPPLAVAKGLPPPDPDQAVKTGRVSDEIAAVVDALPTLISSPPNVDNPVVFGVGTLQAPAVDIDGVKFAVSAIAAAYAGLRAKELAGVLFDLAAGGLPGVPRTDGLGRYLGGIVRSVALASSSKRQSFLESFTKGLTARASDVELQQPVAHFSGTAAADLDRLKVDIDQEDITSDDARKQLWWTADVNKVGDEDDSRLIKRGQEAADQVFDTLLRHATRVFVKESDEIGKRVRNARVEMRCMLPTQQAPARGNTDPFHRFAPQHYRDEKDALATALVAAGEIGDTFASWAYATALSASHVMIERLAAQNPLNLEDRQIGFVHALWRAALNGLLELRPVPADRKTHLAATENSDSFPAVCSVLYGGAIVGFTSAELGFVPAVDALDDEKGLEPPVALKQLAGALSATRQADTALLAAFARVTQDVFGAQNGQIPWLRLLCEGVGGNAVGGQQAQRDVAANTKNGVRRELRGAEGNRVIAVPLKADSAAVARIERAASDEQDMWPSSASDDVTTIAFSPWGGVGKPVVRFRGEGATREYLWIDHDTLARAVRATPAPAVVQPR